jgi:hypothetical protein
VTSQPWTTYDQGWYEALIDTAALVHPFTTARRIARKLTAPPDPVVLAVPGYRDGYKAARLAIRNRIGTGTTIWRLSALLLVSIRTMRAQRDAAIAELIAEAEHATQHGGTR